MRDLPTRMQWERVGKKPHHGIMVPLFSLHTERGGGEFLDLLPLIDGCKQWGLDVLQLLPLNHEEGESSPYNCISSCALNCMHLSLYALPFVDEEWEEAKSKEIFLRRYAQRQGARVLATPEARAFITAQEGWLKPYALFRALKKEFQGAPWESWPLECRSLSHEAINALIPLYAEEIAFHSLVQYLCFTQLRQVKLHAQAQGVLLMGDLPILMGRHSADVWQYGEYFDLNLGAGAPPDAYNREGQNWGFPLFNWEAMRKDHFAWWKRRLAYAENFYDVFRLDHILGFFRFFAIPPGRPSREGFYIPADEAVCKKLGLELLTMIASHTKMLPIGEDLGTMLPCVRPCLESLGICGTRLMHWERRWESDRSYIPGSEFSPFSLTCVSTHDSEPLTLWWRNRPEEAAAYARQKGWVYTGELTAEQREAILWESHHSASLFHVNPLSETLACFPELVHARAEEERVNVPGTCAPSNWSYRFVPSVEEMVAHEGLKKLFHRLLTGRQP